MSTTVSNETLRAWIQDAERLIESGVATDHIAVCPKSLIRACRELLQTREEWETLCKAAETYHASDVDALLLEIRAETDDMGIIRKIDRALMAR